MENSEKKKGLFFKQSSELEILISAAIVFAAFQIHDVVPRLIASLLNYNVPGNSPILLYVVVVALFLGVLLPISIVTHFIIRFYWLSLVGLSTAFEDKDIDNAEFNEKYLLKKSNHSFIEKHIDQVDKVSSSIFAFSFLIIFAFCLSMISILLFAVILEYIYSISKDILIARVVLNILTTLIILTYLITFIDFFTMGGLKRIKKRWFVKIYQPLQKFMGWITLSFLYRGIYYSFIQRVSKKILMIALPVYIILATLLLNLGYYSSSLYAEDSSSFFLNGHARPTIFYAENFDETSIVTGPYIQSYYNTHEFMELGIPLTNGIDSYLTNHCENVTPINEQGFHWRRWITTGFNQRNLPDDFDYIQNAETVLNCFSNRVNISIDSLKFEKQTYRFKKIIKPERLVLSTYLDIVDLNRGEHILQVQMVFRDTVNIIIPFIKE